MYIKNKSYNFLEFLAALFIILQCNSIFSTINKICGTIINYSTIGIIALLFIISFFRLISINFNKILYFIMLFGIFIVILFFTEYFFTDSFGLYGYFLFIISPVFFVTYLYDRLISNGLSNSVLNKMVNITVILAVISLFYWILNLNNYPTNTSVIMNWGGTRIINGYNYIDFITQNISIGNLSIIRNTGIFPESPMYSYVLTIALIIQLFVLRINKKSDVIKSIIIFITIVSTVSTTGIIVSIIVSVYYFFFISNIKTYLKVILLPLGLIAIYLSHIIFDGKKSADLNSSYAIRMNDIHATFQSWIDHPLLGVGINNSSYIEKYMYPFRLLPNGNNGLSTGFYLILAYGGILLALFYLCPSILAMLRGKRTFILAVSTLILFVYTIIPFTYLYSLILSYFWLCAMYGKDYDF